MKVDIFFTPFLKRVLEVEFETFCWFNALGGTCERLAKCVVLKFALAAFSQYLTRHIVLLWSCNVLVYVLANLIKER